MSSASAKRKVLLMGKSGSGKTSMRSIIFANYIARDTNRLGPTIEVEHAHVRFLGNLVLHLWDCGGQETFMDNYLATQRDQAFKNVQVLIYVFDVESRELGKDLTSYQQCLQALISNSPNAQVFCLVHKMDLIEESKRNTSFAEKEKEILRCSAKVYGNNSQVIKIFRSSIWDETLYKAWSAIVYRLIPNVTQMEEKLKIFAEAIEADELTITVLFPYPRHWQAAGALPRKMDRPTRNMLWFLFQLFGDLLQFAIGMYLCFITLFNTRDAFVCTFLANRKPECQEILPTNWVTLIAIGIFFTGFSLFYVLGSGFLCVLNGQSHHQLYLIQLEKTFYTGVLLSIIVAFHSVLNAFLLLFCLFWSAFCCHVCYPEICIFQQLKSCLKKIPLAFYFPTDFRDCLKPIAARSFLIKVDLSLFIPDFAQKALEEIECTKKPESIVAIPDLDDKNSRLFLVTMEDPEDVQTILTNFLCLKLLFVFDFELHRVLCYESIELSGIYCGSICEKAFYGELEKHNSLDFYFE